MGDRALSWGVAFACLAFAVLLYVHGGQDDTYITYWAAHSFSETGLPLNYNGELVEQSSSLGLVILLGGLRVITRLDVPLLGWMVSLGLFVWSVLLVNCLARRFIEPGAARWFAAAAGSVPCFAYWSTSGMETPLVVVASLLALSELSWAAVEPGRGWRAHARSFTIFFVLASARPETPLLGVGLVAVAAVWTAPAGRLSRSASLLASCLAGVAALVGLRLALFGQWVPNPALIKKHGFDPIEGLFYLLHAAAVSNPILLIVGLLGVGVVLSRLVRRLGRTVRGEEGVPEDLEGARREVLLVLLSALAGAYLAFIVASGGDWMRGGRFFALVAPSLVLLTAALAGMATSPRVPRLLGVTLLLSHLVTSVHFLRTERPEGRPLTTAFAAVEKVRPRVDAAFWSFELTNKVHARDAVIGSELAPLVRRASEALGRPVTLMSGQAGLVAFHTFRENPDRARFIDLWGITDRKLLDCLGSGAFKYSNIGASISVNKALSGLEERGEACGLGGLPDIYFNETLRPQHRTALAQHGYVVVYHQTGSVMNASSERWLPSQNTAEGHIAVRADLARALGLAPANPWKWDLNPE